MTRSSSTKRTVTISIPTSSTASHKKRAFQGRRSLHHGASIKGPSSPGPGRRLADRHGVCDTLWRLHLHLAFGDRERAALLRRDEGARRRRGARSEFGQVPALDPAGDRRYACRRTGEVGSARRLAARASGDEIFGSNFARFDRLGYDPNGPLPKLPKPGGSRAAWTRLGGIGQRAMGLRYGNLPASLRRSGRAI